MGLFGPDNIEYTRHNQGGGALHTLQLSTIEEQRFDDALQHCYKGGEDSGKHRGVILRFTTTIKFLFML